MQTAALFWGGKQKLVSLIVVLVGGRCASKGPRLTITVTAFVWFCLLIPPHITLHITPPALVFFLFWASGMFDVYARPPLVFDEEGAVVNVRSDCIRPGCYQC